MADDKNAQNNAQLWRPIVAVLAAAVIAFCGWSAWQYAHGNDPLAFLESDALQTVEEEPAAESAVNLATTSNTVDAEDVTAALTSLSFDGEDVSLAEGTFEVVVSGRGIWVEQTSTEEAAAMVEASAKRAAALAAWAGEQGVDLTSVTWICEDAAHAVRLVATYGTSGVPASGDAATLLGAAQSYAICGDAYAELGDGPAYAQSAGGVPALPNGTEISVPADTTASGETLSEEAAAQKRSSASDGNKSASSEQGGKGSSSSGSSNGSSSGNSNGGSGSSSGSNAGSQGSSSATSDSTGVQQSSTITVYITVDGSAAGAGSSSATLGLSAGATVYDALAASGVGFNSAMTGYGMYVSSIGGLAEKEHGGMSGWVYAVNGVEPNTACSNYVLHDGDSVYWSYVNVEY